MSDRIQVDPQKQFSKRLARWTAFFWFLYMTWLSVIMLLQPQAALYTVYMGIIVTVVMVLNVWAYTKNSIYEKGVLAMLNKTQIEIGLKNGRQNLNGEEGEDDEEMTTGEGGSNG